MREEVKFFLKKSEKIQKEAGRNLANFWSSDRCKGVNLEDLVKRFPTSICLQSVDTADIRRLSKFQDVCAALAGGRRGLRAATRSACGAGACASSCPRCRGAGPRTSTVCVFPKMQNLKQNKRKKENETAYPPVQITESFDPKS